jgi:hypothetical protein
MCEANWKNWLSVSKLSCNSQWNPIGLGDVQDPIFSRQSAHRWLCGCQPYAPASHPLPPRRFLVRISVSGLVNPRARVRLEGLNQLKIPMTWTGIELATFWFVALCVYTLPHYLSWDYTREDRVGGWRLTAWATDHLISRDSTICISE